MWNEIAAYLAMPSQQEMEANEKLNETLSRLMQASVAKRASEREKRLNDCLRDMKRLYPGE
jgi:uncharacterized protein YneF (UPF0154 family)